MTKPDPNLPDPEAPDPDPADARSPGAHTPGAHSSDAQPQDPTADAQGTDDDAVWLDLVARLEGLGEGAAEPGADWPDDAGTGGGGAGGGADRAGGNAAAARTFRDFDPLGLAGTAPIELSAAERLDPARGKPAAAGGDEVPDTASGPRDYEPEDDDGAFVPEEPPSLAGADPKNVLAWIGAVGGPIALVLSSMFWRSAPLLAILGMVAAFVVSVVFLIMQLPSEKDEHDDGARI